MDRILKFFVVLIVVFIIGAIIALFKTIERGNQAKELASKMNCELLGSAKHLPSVVFLECDGDIKLVRMK